MKALVYYDFKEINDKEVSINKERLNQILEEVYQAGYNDGSKGNYTAPYIPYTPLPTKPIYPSSDPIVTWGDNTSSTKSSGFKKY